MSFLRRFSTLKKFPDISCFGIPLSIHLMQSFDPHPYTAMSISKYLPILNSGNSPELFSGRLPGYGLYSQARKFLHTICRIFVPVLWHLFNMKSRFYITLIPLFLLKWNCSHPNVYQVFLAGNAAPVTSYWGVIT